MPCVLQATSAKHFTRLATQLARTSGSLARSRATMACRCVLAKRALKCDLQRSVAQGQPADHTHEKDGFATRQAQRFAMHGAMYRMHSQSIPFRPLWALQATFAETSCLAVASARKVPHTFHFATTPLADSMPFLARGGFLAYLAHLLNRSPCSRMWRSGQTQWTTWLADSMPFLARGGFLAYLAHLLNRSLCSRMRRSGPTQRTTWLARVSGSLARSMAASACLRALAKHAPMHAQQHTLA